MAEQPFASDDTLTEFAIKRGIVDASKLEPIVIDSPATACTNRPACPCPRCQTRLNKLLRDHQTRMKNANSPLNRAERRAAKKLRKRR